MIALHSDLEFKTATLKIERESDLKKKQSKFNNNSAKTKFCRLNSNENTCSEELQVFHM